MVILGWDIGIKNLSYCLVEYTGNSNQPIEDVYTNCKIKLWGIVDLLETDISLPKNKQKKCKDLKLVNRQLIKQEWFDFHNKDRLRKPVADKPINNPIYFNDFRII